MKQVIVFLYCAFINAVHSYIFRLPCLRHANFTIFSVDHYFHGTVKSSLEREDCVLNCVSHDTCAFFNYVYQNKTCELFNNAEGDIIKRIGTDIYYAKSFPMENRCGSDTAKFLDCSTNGFTCMLLKNEALGKTVEATSFANNNFKPIFITDGKWVSYHNMCWVSSSLNTAHWIMVDVGVSIDVVFLELINVPRDACDWCHIRLTGFNITIGNDKEPTTKNALCSFNANQENIMRRKYDCLGGVTSGRYISVKENKASRGMNVCELRVYAVNRE